MTHFVLRIKDDLRAYDFREIIFDNLFDAEDFRQRFLRFINPVAVITIHEVNHESDKQFSQAPCISNRQTE